MCTCACACASVRVCVCVYNNNNPRKKYLNLRVSGNMEETGGIKGKRGRDVIIF